jgi:acetyltransferase-like isoleucine patch superfamily enzyme/acyl carrier protein
LGNTPDAPVTPPRPPSQARGAAEGRPSSVHALFHRLALAASRATGAVRLRGVTRVGRGARVEGTPFIHNEGSIVIGDDLRLSSVPVQSHLVTRGRGRITIGDGVHVGCGAAIASEAGITIGDGVLLAAGCMLLDTDFHGSDDYARASEASPIVIEGGATLGRGVVVLKGTRIGRGARVAAGSVVSGIVAPGAVVSGVPARVQRAAAARRGDASGEPGDVLERVRTVVSEVFSASRPVEPSDGPATIPSWDSLGALRLLLALEDELRVVLADDVLRNAQTVAEVAEAVAGALQAD